MKNTANKQENMQKPTPRPERQYEKSGLYPENGKQFRIWALFGWLTLLLILIAGVAALLDTILL